MTTTSDTAKYVFTRAEQWELYSRELKDRAIDTELWQYMDPDDNNRIPWPTKPVKRCSGPTTSLQHSRLS